MKEVGPSIGYAAILHGLSAYEATEAVLRHLEPMLVSDGWSGLGGPPTRGLDARIRVGTADLDVISITLDVDESVYVFVEFADERLAELARRDGLDIVELLAPFVSAAQRVPECLTILISFEPMPPRDLADETLRRQGVAVFLERLGAGNRWRRREFCSTMGIDLSG